MRMKLKLGYFTISLVDRGSIYEDDGLTCGNLHTVLTAMAKLAAWCGRSKVFFFFGSNSEKERATINDKGGKLLMWIGEVEF